MTAPLTLIQYQKHKIHTLAGTSLPASPAGAAVGLRFLGTYGFFSSAGRFPGDHVHGPPRPQVSLLSQTPQNRWNPKPKMCVSSGPAISPLIGLLE